MSRAGRQSKKFVAEYHDCSHPLRRLPFVAAPGSGVHYEQFFWGIPANGDYGDGCQAGKAAALAWLKHKRAVGNRDFGGGDLQHVVFAIFERFKGATSREREVLRGHVVGFFAEIDAWASAAACWEGSSGVLERLTEEDVCRQLQDAADCGPSQRRREESAAERSRAASKAASARWGRRRKQRSRIVAARAQR